MLLTGIIFNKSAHYKARHAIVGLTHIVGFAAHADLGLAAAAHHHIQGQGTASTNGFACLHGATQHDGALGINNLHPRFAYGVEYHNTVFG